MKIGCVIFDLDQTLVNLTDFVDWRRAEELILQAYLQEGIPKNLAESLSGRGLIHLLVNINEELLKIFPRERAEEIQAKAYGAMEKCELEGVSSTQLMPGCPQGLHWLKGRGVKRGIVSFNSDLVVNKILNLHGLNSLIDAVVARNPRYRMKPHPDQFLLCLEKLGCKPENAVALGDSRWDMTAARKAKILPIGVLTGSTSRGELLTAGANRVMRNLWELPDTLSALGSSLSST